MSNSLEEALKAAFGDLDSLDDLLEAGQGSATTKSSLPTDSMVEVSRAPTESAPPPVKRPCRRRPAHPPSLVTPLPLVTHTTQSVPINDPFSYILETFDNLIANQIQLLPNQPSSALTLRRFLYRKHFSELAFKELQSLTLPITCVDQLVPIIMTACAKCGLVIL